MSNKRFKQQTTSMKKFVGTLPNGIKVQADTMAKLKDEIAKVDQQVVTTKRSETVKPQFDPNTGERIN